LQPLIDFHLSRNAMATLAIQQRKSSRQLLFNANKDEWHLKGWINHQTQETRPTNLPKENLQPFSFSGIQILNTAIFNHKEPLSGKFSLIDWYLQLCQHRTIFGWDHSGDTLLDVGKPESLATASQLIKDFT